MFIEDDDFEPNAELVRRFVARMLELAQVTRCTLGGYVVKPRK